MVNGRGRFDIPARGWRRTSRTVGPQDNGQGDIVTRIVGDVAAGLTVRQIAAERHLPVDFVDMAIERARERGSLDVVDMRRDGMPTRPRFVGVRGMSIQVFPIFGLVK